MCCSAGVDNYLFSAAVGAQLWVPCHWYVAHLLCSLLLCSLSLPSVQVVQHHGTDACEMNSMCAWCAQYTMLFIKMCSTVCTQYTQYYSVVLY